MAVTHPELDALQEQLDSLREQAVHPEEAVSSNPAVQAAGIELARAVGQSLGIDMPLQVADGSSLPVIELPREFAEQGGVGVAVVVARPPQD